MQVNTPAKGFCQHSRAIGITQQVLRTWLAGIIIPILQEWELKLRDSGEITTFRVASVWP